MNDRNNLIPFVIFSAALIISAVIISLTWKSNYESAQSINVTGSAKKEITSDLGVLRGTISSEAATAEEAYRKLKQDMPVLLSYLEKHGFSKDKVEIFTPTNFPQYEMSANGYQTNNIRSYVYSQRIEIQSKDVQKIKQISLEISSLVESGLNFNVEMPEYHYTALADLKIKIQAEAAKDAMVRAEKIAEATGRDLGNITSARMGVLQITPRLSNQISGYGINDLSSIEKEITAVVNASFEID